MEEIIILGKKKIRYLHLEIYSSKNGETYEHILITVMMVKALIIEMENIMNIG